ncbi:MAG: Do family serine endopeptidase [Hyphomonas sp.]|nr:Do family serine endopeptidase [Hyphomonas sp.]MBU4061336.1 Do family serine endopeptidase [Alphaproteobacteria bacterium]MBU4162589.1 Do family serine endopeptidase [Alphaproteobacteria bacterium]MBU4568698.1 Do family serine endopeptidase [Alphaproteobacteria bacterium]
MTKHVSKLLAFASLAVLMLITVALAPMFAQAQQVPQSQEQISLSFAPLVRQASPAVVNVYTAKVTTSRATTMEQLLYGVPAQGTVQNSLGSGVIVASDGVIITNNHVIQGADTFRVVLSDRREYEAELLLADARTDLAVLKIDTGTEQLPTLPFADSRGVQVGDLVLAIGNPFGVGQTVTNGIISATARTDVGVSDYSFFLQTDAAVNPGNSGGALINTKGELVGVNTAIYSRTGGSVGIGFAIPSEMVKRVVDAAVNGGTFVRPWLGLAAQAVSFDIAKTQGLSRPVGVIVTEVYPEGPAAKAGLRRGDLVTAIDDREVFDEKGLKFLAAVRKPGELAKLSVLRGGKSQTISVRVQPPPGATEADVVLLSDASIFNGARVIELSPRLAEENGLDPFSKGSGIYVHSVTRGTISRNYFQPGDIIRAVNGKPTKTVKDLQAVLSKSGRSWEIEIERNGRTVKGTVKT